MDLYLPPTMSPCETSQLPGLLEHPAQALDYYRRTGIQQVVCQEKHMGSRAVIIAERDPETIRKRFGFPDGPTGASLYGACYTRTGRRFFNQPETEARFLERVGAAVQQAGLLEELNTGWIALDCEIMPWSLKAQELLKDQYAPVAAAARASLQEAQAILGQAAERGVNVGPALERVQKRRDLADRYGRSYAHYCWGTDGLQDVRLAPFHLIASEGRVHSDQDHRWHMAAARRLADADPGLITATEHRTVDLNDPQQEEDITRWWNELTQRGGEGMVVKPLDFAARTDRGLVQPAVKCRGPEYLRII